MRLSPHLSALLLALLLGAVLFVPETLAVAGMGSTFQGVYPEHHDDELYYLARGQEVLDGHPFLGNAYLAEGKDAPGFQLWLPDAVLAYPLGALHIPVPEGYRVYDLLLPPVAFLLLYALLLALARRRSLALLGSSFLFLGIFLDELSRTPSPQLNVIALLAFLLAAHTAYEGGKKRIALLAGLLFGLLFYTYYYYWTYAGALLAFLFLADLLRKRKPVAPFLMLAVGGVVALPYLLSVYAASRLPYYAELLARLGAIHSRVPSALLIVLVGGALLALAGFLLLWKKLRPSPALLFALAGVSAGLVAANQHLLTGLNLEFSSHYLLPFSLFSAALLAVLFGAMRDRVPARVRSGAATALLVLVALAVLGAVRTEVRGGLLVAPSDLADERYGPVLAWLRAHTAKDDVVLTDDRLSYLVPAYTGDNVLANPYAGYFYLPTEELEERWLIAHPDEDLATADAVRAEDSRNLFGVYYVDLIAHAGSENALRKLAGLPALPLPAESDADVARVAGLAKDVDAMKPAERLARYRVDYVVGEGDAGVGALAKAARLPVLATFGDLTVYAGPR